MGDYFRFFLNDLPPAFERLEAGFRSFNPRFRLVVDLVAGNVADLILRDDVYAEIEINSADGELYQEDVADLRSQLEDPPPDTAEAVRRVIERLDSARSMIALRLTDFGSVDYAAIDPIWDWLFARYDGMLEIDDEGYYTREGELLSLL
ncbi:hypothetical protein FBR02_10215 [Anaerolineae bacterium CFX9]|nr:hypothetical protein [Anaerolineae bacterium CFX9]